MCIALNSHPLPFALIVMNPAFYICFHSFTVIRGASCVETVRLECPLPSAPFRRGYSIACSYFPNCFIFIWDEYFSALSSAFGLESSLEVKEETLW